MSKGDSTDAFSVCNTGAPLETLVSRMREETKGATQMLEFYTHLLWLQRPERLHNAAMNAA